MIPAEPETWQAAQRQSMLARRALDAIGDLARRKGCEALSGTVDAGTSVPKLCGSR
jgi:hypothetical protein